jgi:hypothetical protein
MRTYYSRVFLLILALLASSCAAPALTPQPISVTLTADGRTQQLSLAPGSSVEQALAQAQISLGALDRSEPELFSLLADGAEIRVVRVNESFEIVQEVIPFQSQVLHNESLPNDQEILIQAGKNGQREITYRQVSEDGVLVSSQPIPVKSVVITEPLPEIRMVGIQAPFAPIAIQGKLYYLRDGNLWLMEGNSANRRAILTSGDLDGRIFSISADGQWMIFTRRASEPEQINNLFALNLWESADAKPGEAETIDLKVPNLIHFADWKPGGETRIVFSTVEPRPSAPGWQANNDLHALVFSSSGWTTQWSTLVDTNSGGVYGWWGTDFAWSPDGSQMAFSRPDGIGLVDLDEGLLTPTLPITPLQTRGDWAWTPGLAWNSQGDRLFTVDHPARNPAIPPEESQAFDLISVSLDGKDQQTLVSQSGMFAYPLVSPPGENGAAQVAYLQALFPNQSETSRYQVAIVDENGKSQRTLFPKGETAGLEPSQHWGAWSPVPTLENQTYALAVLYQGNIWLIDTKSGEGFQITADHLTYRIIWK